jgi:hypothetical protein
MAAPKKDLDAEEGGPVERRGVGSGPTLVSHVIDAAGIIFASSIFAIGISYAATILANKPEPPKPAPNPFIIVSSGGGGAGQSEVWRLNTLTGEMIACRSVGPSGIIQNDPAGAGCWKVGVKP